MNDLIEETSAPQDMGELLDSVEDLKPLRRGDVVEGVVMRSDHEGVLVNIGHKAEGLVPPGEMRTLQKEDGDLNIGDEIVAFVVKGETAEEAAILSIDRAVGEKGWRVLEKALESGELVKGKILGFNRGGSIVESEGVQAFVPMSQLVSVSRDVFREVRSQMDRAEEQATTEEQDGAETQDEAESQDGAETQDEAEDQDGAEVQDSAEEQDSQPEEPEPPDEIGKELELKVLEVNRSRNRAILSERQAVQSMRERRKAELIKELSVGEVRTGKVTGISSFGAFVDLGGADGLVHISELTWTPVSSPEEVVHLGQDVEVYVLRVDAENNKIALSLKRLQREPWETITDHVQVDDVVDATVTKLTDFGAFARVEGSVEGLIHISELTSRMIGHPREVVREGDAVKVKVLRIEPERRRLGLSIKQAEEQDQGYDG